MSHQEIIIAKWQIGHNLWLNFIQTDYKNAIKKAVSNFKIVFAVAFFIAIPGFFYAEGYLAKIIVPTSILFLPVLIIIIQFSFLLVRLLLRKRINRPEILITEKSILINKERIFWNRLSSKFEDCKYNIENQTLNFFYSMPVKTSRNNWGKTTIELCLPLPEKEKHLTDKIKAYYKNLCKQTI